MGRELEHRRLYIPTYEDDPAYRRQVSLHNAALDLAEEKVHDAERGRRRAWFVTWAMILICAGQAAAIAIMLPLKEVTPYTILVDRQTGYVETVRGLQLGELQEDEALVHSFLAQYVMQRETFDPSDFQDRYERVALWSTETARSSYLALYQAGSPESILDDMRAGETLTVTIKQIELVDRSTARVRFTLAHRNQGVASTTSDWQALISYRFSGAPMRMEDRLINPLGFQVVSYRRDAEGPAIPPTDTAELEIRGPVELDAGAAAEQPAPARRASARITSQPVERAVEGPSQ
jgi:type IV secretion system protein VirB8